MVEPLVPRLVLGQRRRRDRHDGGSRPVHRAVKASTSADSSIDRDSARAPWPTSRSARIRIGPVAGGRVLQRGAQLAGVQRVDPGVAVEDGEQRRRVVDALDDPVVRRVRQQPAELLGVVGGAVLDVPGRAESELLVAHHVEQRRRADDGAEEVGPLGHRRADEQAAVGAAADGQLARACVQPSADEPLGRGVEVVEDVLLVAEHAVAVPLLALLAAAAQVGDRVDAAGLDPGEDGGREAGVSGRPNPP